MMTDRAGIFDDKADEVEFDVTGFAPKKESTTTQAPPEAVRAVSERSEFRSREPAPVIKEKPSAREPRRHRTGRNVQLSIKVRKEAHADFYKITDAKNWVLGETFERAIEALKKELGIR